MELFPGVGYLVTLYPLEKEKEHWKKVVYKARDKENE